VVAFGKHAPAPATALPTGVSINNFALAVGAGLFAFGGWHMVTYSAGETRRPEKTVPRSLLIGTLIVTACYVALNAACLYLLPLDQVIRSTRVAADAASVLVGEKGAAAISGLVLISAFGVLNGVILAGPRVYLAMAGRYQAMAWVGSVHPRYRTPHVAILIQALWSCILVATGTYRDLFTRVIYTEWIFFALMGIGLMRARRRPDYRPAYRAWGSSLVPLVFITASLGVVFYQVAADPKKTAVGLLLVVLGLPLYYFWVRKSAASSK
jgi:APA family basic amino acid/polyamine antiporter